MAAQYEPQMAIAHPVAVKFEDDADHVPDAAPSPAADDDDASKDDDDIDHVEGPQANSSNSDSPARKRRRSRKGLDKKFDCPHDACGKSYSRAEHLYRHQLNHNAKIVFNCSFKGCNRTFVRQDLRNRHMERHTARGSTLGRRDSTAGQASPVHDRPHVTFQAPPGSASPESGRPVVTSLPNIPTLAARTQLNYQSPKDPVTSPYTPITNTPPARFPTSSTPSAAGVEGNYIPPEPYPTTLVPQPNQQHPTRQASSPYSVVSAVSTYAPPTSHAVSFVPHQNVLPFNLPPSEYINGHGHPPRDTGQPYGGPPPATTASAPAYPDTDTPNQSSEMVMLDQMSMQATIPVFGTDGLSNKSPYAIPEDFIAYLFNTHGSDLARVENMVRYATYNDYGNQYGMPLGTSEIPSHYFPPAPQQVMAVNNLLGQNFPEATISVEKSQEIYDFIRERFHEKNHSPVDKRKESIFDGDHSDPTHLLSNRMMQAYIGAYWLHFSDQIPILHQPTFSPDKTPNLLLVAIMTIGAACLDRSQEEPDTRAGTKVSNFLAWNLRWEVFMDVNFAPPSKLWIFQTLILLELYEKMFTTRELHERAHIHHATTITLMRRGRSLIGKSALESPPNPRTETPMSASHQSSAPGSTSTPDDWWNNWITHESTRRTAFAAFVIDSIHCTMFGHSTVMVAHEMRLPLPCDDSLWNAPTAGNMGRMEARLAAENLKPVSFIEGLKKTLGGLAVHTNSFGRTVLMTGLLSVGWHMHQRDLQINVLGAGSSLALGARDQWRNTLTRAFDAWKDDYDRALHRAEPAQQDPYGFKMTRSGHDSVVFESRIVLLHLAHMAMHADVVDCQMFARAKRLLGRAISPQDLYSVQRRMRDAWAPSASARDATFYALKFLCFTLMPEAAGGAPRPRAQGPAYEEDMPYSARNDMLLNRPWVLYFAALVLWSYGHALEGPCPNIAVPETQQDMLAQMRHYLALYGDVSSPEDVRLKKGLNANSAVLMVLRETFKRTRWDLLHEAANLLNNCIILNSGGVVT